MITAASPAKEVSPGFEILQLLDGFKSVNAVKMPQIDPKNLPQRVHHLNVDRLIFGNYRYLVPVFTLSVSD
jgi:hypothetical protein